MSPPYVALARAASLPCAVMHEFVSELNAAKHVLVQTLVLESSTAWPA